MFKLAAAAAVITFTAFAQAYAAAPSVLCAQKADAQCVSIIDKALDKAIDGAFYVKTVGGYAEVDAQKDLLDKEIDRLKWNMGASKLSITMALGSKLDKLRKELNGRDAYLSGRQPKANVVDSGFAMKAGVDF